MLRRMLAAGLLCAWAALAGDVSGIWNGQIADRNGDPQDISFQLIQNGTALTGKMYGDNASFPISEAAISGKQIVFAVKTELNGQSTKVVFTGSVEGDRIVMTRERQGGAKPEPKQTVLLKRVA